MKAAMKNTPIRRLGAQLGYLAAVVNAVAFVWYSFGILSGETETNPITWWLWLAETFIGLLIYADRTRDTSKWLAEAISMVGVTIVGGYLIFQVFAGHQEVVLHSVQPIDFLSAGLAAVALIFWISTRKRWGAGASLWVFQLALFSAAFPLIRAVAADPSSEPFWPWALWTGAFVLQALCAMLRWDGKEPLLNPINYAVTHGLVAWIIWFGALG